MPKRIFGCVHCFDETIELKLIKMYPDHTTPCIFLTTYQCPNCKECHYDTHNKNREFPIPDEFSHVSAARQAKKTYDEKLKIYEKLQNETNEEEIKRLKQDKFYDPDFDPETFGSC